MKTKSCYVKLLHTVLICFSLTFSSNVVFGQILLNSSFEGTNPFSGFVNNQSCCSYSVTASTNHPHSGTQSFRSEVRVGDPAVSSGWRAELTTSNISDQGNMWYGFSVYFETPVSGQYWTGSYGGHFIQWHPNNGSGSAELAIYGSEGLWDVTVNPSGGAGGTHQTQTASGGALKKITANVWHDVVFHVQWGSGGMVEVWIDGELYFTKSGLNWAANAYLKFGMNRWGNCSSAPCDTWVIYYDNLKIGRDVTYNDVAPTASTPGNQSPTVNAGNNQTITLPTTTATLTGSASDPDGTISSYAWTNTASPLSAVPLIGNATSNIANLTGLTVPGTYTFRLTVTDNAGATAFDEVNVVVNALPNLPPTVSAGVDQTLTMPTNFTSLAGSGTDPDGTIASYAWTRVSGPTTYTMTNANTATPSITGLVAGNTYIFKLTVTDNGGATASDNVSIIMNAAPQAPTANAGANITLTLPVNSTTLTGSGADADGTITGYAWTRVGTTTLPATIGSPTNSSTQITGLVAGTYTFRLTVTDNSGMTNFDDITVTVNPAANQLPTVNAGNNITITLPTNSVLLNGTGNDPDGSITGYVWTRVGVTTLPATIGSPNNSSTQITGLVAGAYTFRLTVTDNSGATAFDDVIITVNAAANQVPSANAGNNIVLTLPVNSTTLNGSGTDPDGTIASYTWTKSGTLAGTINSPNNSSTDIVGLVQGNYIFRLTVTDNSGATAFDDVNVTVNASPGPANQAPIANAGTNITISLPQNSTSLNGNGSIDLDGTISTYAWSWVSGTGTYTLGAPGSAICPLNNLQVGTYVFRLTVTDNGGSTDIDNIVVTVNAAANQVPSANAGNNITITLPTNSVQLNGSGTDLDGTISAYAWSRASGGTIYTFGTPNSNNTSVTGLVAGSYTFRLTVTDNNGATATDDVIVTVNPAVIPNQPPVARAGNDIIMTLPTNSTTLNGNASTDADGTIVSYSWVRTGGTGGTYTFTSAGSIATGLNNLQAGTYIFRLTVTDNSGASSTDDITVTVNAAANQLPVANAGNDITITLPVNSTNLVGSGTDADGTIVGYLWERTNGPTTYTLSNATAMSPALTGLVQGVYTFRLTVTDNNGGNSTDNVLVIVNAAGAPTNQLPTANAGPDRNITLPVNTTTLAGSGTDPDGTVVAYNWVRLSGPTTFLVSNPSANSTPLSNLVQGTYVFQLTVTDNYGGKATDLVTVTVNAAIPGANQAPAARITVDSIVLVLPLNSTSLNGSTSTDADGIIASYAWTQLSGPTTATITGGTTAIGQVSALTLGVYTFQLRVTDDDGASSTRAVKVIVKNSNGEGRYFNLYPNPATGNLTLQYFENGNGKFRISIYDAARKLVKDGFVDKNQVTLTETMNVSNLKNGMYFIQMVLPDGKTISKQFVKM
jgi:ribosomal protein L14